MQIIRVQTNIQNVDIPDKFEEELCHTLSIAMDLHSNQFLVLIEPAMRLTLGTGSKQTPMAIVNITTTRPSSQLENDNYAKKLSAVFKTFLKLESDKILIIFDQKDAKNVAINSKTLASLYT